MSIYIDALFSALREQLAALITEMRRRRIASLIDLLNRRRAALRSSIWAAVDRAGWRGGVPMTDFYTAECAAADARMWRIGGRAARLKAAAMAVS